MELVRSLPFRILKSAAHLAVAQTETIIFSFILGCTMLPHHQKERQQKEQMHPCLIYIAVCVPTAIDRETHKLLVKLAAY